jgi:hypothetical protein
MIRRFFSWLGFGRSREDSTGDSPADVEDDEATDDDSVWNLIPYWQYDGVYVGNGGVTQKEQEDSIRVIQEQAEAIEDHPEDHPPEEQY